MATKSIVIDLEKCIDKEVRVTFQGGREVRGVLKGFDQLVNIVLDDCVEEMHDPDDPYKKTDERRRLGLVVCRGLQVSLVSPVDGMEEIANPFIQQEDGMAVRGSASRSGARRRRGGVSDASRA